jgi:hypothetical protein
MPSRDGKKQTPLFVLHYQELSATASHRQPLNDAQALPLRFPHA